MNTRHHHHRGDSSIREVYVKNTKEISGKN